VRIYLDHNATTPLDPRVGQAVADALGAGNPSSVHQEGREARDRVERARRQVAAFTGAGQGEIVFTSGGTEANHLALVGLARLGRRRVLVASIEHPSVLEPARALGASLLAVDGEGRIDLAGLERALADPVPALVAVAAVNHELGTIQDLVEVARLAAAAGALLHVDAVQAAGRLPLEAIAADTLSISAHKIHGPKGAGALRLRRGLDLGPLWPGGHQERERRPGTENVAGIVGLGAAAELASPDPGLVELGGALERGLIALGARVHGAGASRVPGVVNAGFAGAPGELVVQALDLAGVACSTGAACTSGTVTASPVLLALGLPRERALEAVRFSAGRGTTLQEVQVVLELLPDIIARIRAHA
jgi:cysteine desulfurase